MAPRRETSASVVMRHRQKPPQQFKLGFSIGAFLLGPLWAIYRRLWLVLMFMLLAYVPVVFLDEYAQANKNRSLLFPVLGLYLAYMIICGVYGNRWRKWTLERRGYVVEQTAGG